MSDNTNKTPGQVAELRKVFYEAFNRCPVLTWESGDTAIDHGIAAVLAHAAPKYDAEIARLRAELDAAKAVVEKLRYTQTMGNVPTPDFLEWVAARLVHVHGENPNVDFVLSLRERARVGREAVRASRPAKENANAKA